MRAVRAPSMGSDNSLHATSTPWALRDYAVSRRSELRGSAVVRPGRSSETPLSPWARRDISTLWKMKKLFAIFFNIFVRSHGALRNFKSPRQRRGIAVECDRGFIWRVFFLIVPPNQWYGQICQRLIFTAEPVRWRRTCETQLYKCKSEFFYTRHGTELVPIFHHCSVVLTFDWVQQKVITDSNAHKFMRI